MKYQIYCDMDGVLCDFWPVILNLMNKTVQDIIKIPKIITISDIAKKALLATNKINRNYFILNDIMKEYKAHKEVRDFMFALISNNQELWEDLSWMEDGHKLWNFIKEWNPIILSSPVDSDSIEGKQNWIKNNLGNNIKSIFEKDKWKYANSKSILIDDYNFNIDNWEEHNGIGILHKNASKTIKQLKEIL